MPGPQQITGLQGYVLSEPELSPAGVHGSSVNPVHGHKLWEQDQPYPWESAIDGLGGGHDYLAPQEPTAGIGEQPGIIAAGRLAQDPTGDQTPYKGHAAPFPKGLIFNRATGPNHLPDGNAEYLKHSDAIHSSDTNAGAAWLYDPTMEAVQDHWTDFYDVEVGQSNVAVPDAQSRSGAAPGGWASHGRENSNARQNSYGFDAAHMHRRYATGSIPGNYQWMRPGGRPMVKSMPGPARPAVGPNSPFHGDDVGASFSYHGAVLTDPATEYVAPPQPFVKPATTAVEGQNAPAIDLW